MEPQITAIAELQQKDLVKHIGVSNVTPTLGGFTPLQSDTLTKVASALGVTPMQAVLTWLLQHAPNLLAIPGTSSRVHLRENLASARIALPDDALAALDQIGSKALAS